MKTQEFITTVTAAKELDLTTRTIQKYCRIGEIKARRFGKLYMINRKDWEEWKARKLVVAS